MNSVGKILHTELGNSFADVLTWVLVSKSSRGRGRGRKGVNNNKVKIEQKKEGMVLLYGMGSLG